MAITRLNNNSITSITALPSGVGGKILQIQSTLYTTTFTQSLSVNTATGINNLIVNITPSSTSSKIFLFGRVFCELSAGAENAVYFFTRGGTKINVGATAGNRTTGMATIGSNFSNNENDTPDTVSMFTVDSPSSVSQQTYQIGIETHDATSINVNRTVADTNNGYEERGSSEIIAMEVAG